MTTRSFSTAHTFVMRLDVPAEPVPPEQRVDERWARYREFINLLRKERGAPSE